MATKSLFEAYKESLPTSTYGSVFSSGTPITNLDELFAANQGELAKKSEQAYASGSGLRDYFIGNFNSKITGASSPCNQTELSLLFPSPAERIFLDYISELIEKGFVVGGQTMKSVNDVVQYVLSGGSTALASALDTEITASKCDSVLHQKTGSYLQDAASTFLDNSKQTIDPVIKLPLVEGAEYSGQYTASIINSTSDEVIFELPINSDGTITFTSQYYDITDLNPEEQLSFSAKIAIQDQNGGNVNTIKASSGEEYSFTFPNAFSSSTFVTIEISPSNTINLNQPIASQAYTFNETTIATTLFTSINNVYSFSTTFKSWITDPVNVDYCKPNQIFDDPEGFITAAPDEEEAKAFIALITFNLIALDIKVAARLVDGGYRSLTAIANAPLEDIINLESVDEHDDITVNEDGTFDESDITQVGDYQLYEAHEMAQMAVNVLFNQVLDINAQ